METIDRKEYNRPVIVVVKVESVKMIANTCPAMEPDASSRSFRDSFFEDEE